MGRFKIEISDVVLKKLKRLKEGAAGTLLTSTESDVGIVILGLLLSNTGGEERQAFDADAPELHTPGGIAYLGSFLVSSQEEENVNELQDLVVRVDPSNGTVTTTYELNNVDLVTITEAKIAARFFLVRSRMVLPVSCELTKTGITSMIDDLRKRTDELAVLELQAAPLDTPFVTPNKKKEYSSLKDMETLEVTVQLKVSGTEDSLEEPNKTLLIDYKKSLTKCCQFDLTLDTLTLVPRNEPASELRDFVEFSQRKYLSLQEECLLSQLKNPDSISTPETFHFLPCDAGHFMSVAYPKKKLDRDLGDYRALLHTMYVLPTDRPLLMRGNAFSFTADEPGRELECPHDAVGPSGVVGGEPGLVQGRYTYHHYCQQGVEDDGWGCAYRSLQTLCSWFKLQGYTNRPVPTIKEIQQCLVSIGDKPSSFVGSSQWIGSTEVGFCLDTILGVSSRIATVSSGDEMSMKGGELSHHFRTQGTPVMIGGGNLAHTILGVDYNKKTGDIKFLILDPHYTGADDLHTIIAKGWCGWKPISFWKKGSFYNMCMPIRPKCI